MLKQQHYTLTNVKKVKSQSTTPLKVLCSRLAFKARHDTDAWGDDREPEHMENGMEFSPFLCLSPGHMQELEDRYPGPRFLY